MLDWAVDTGIELMNEWFLVEQRQRRIMGWQCDVVPMMPKARTQYSS